MITKEIESRRQTIKQRESDYNEVLEKNKYLK